VRPAVIRLNKGDFVPRPSPWSTCRGNKERSGEAGGGIYGEYWIT